VLVQISQYTGSRTGDVYLVLYTKRGTAMEVEDDDSSPRAVRNHYVCYRFGRQHYRLQCCSINMLRKGEKDAFSYCTVC